MKIVLCGSMRVKDSILKVGKMLTSEGHTVLYPEECMNDLPKGKYHFDRILTADCVYVVNDSVTINGEKIDNYIGANTLAEIGFAYFFDKDIFLHNDIYEPYRDELEAWGVETLKGNSDEK